MDDRHRQCDILQNGVGMQHWQSALPQCTCTPGPYHLQYEKLIEFIFIKAPAVAANVNSTHLHKRPKVLDASVATSATGS